MRGLQSFLTENPPEVRIGEDFKEDEIDSIKGKGEFRKRKKGMVNSSSNSRLGIVTKSLNSALPSNDLSHLRKSHMTKFSLKNDDLKKNLSVNR